MPEVVLMDEKHIDGMIKALRSQLGDPDRAKKILQRYWTDRIAFIWTIDQAHLAANERALALTMVEARIILKRFHQRANLFDPPNWFTLLEIIDSSGMGRKLTKAELDRFLKTNLAVVAKRSRQTFRA